MFTMKSLILGSFYEIKNNVVLPDPEVLQRSSVLVLVSFFVFSVVIGLVDLAFRNVFSWLYGIF